MVEANVVLAKHLRGGARLAYIRDSISKILSKYEILHGCLEGISHGSIGKKFDLAEVCGTIKTLYHDRGIMHHVVPPSTLKLYAAGHGTADKSRMMKAVREHYGYSTSNDNVADAVALAQAARTIATGAFTRRCELDAVKSITAPPKSKQRRKTKPPLSV